MAVISVKLGQPQFEGQTKAKLGNPEIESAVTSLMTQQLSEYLEDNPGDAKSILEKAATAARAREAAKKARDLVIRKNAMEGGALPGKLADCTEKDPAKRFTIGAILNHPWLIDAPEPDDVELFTE